MRKPSRVVVLLARLYLKIEAYRKEILQLKADNECLRALLQTKQGFEVRG